MRRRAEEELKFARVVFIAGGVWGMAALAPFYWLTPAQIAEAEQWAQEWVAIFKLLPRD